MSKGPARLIHEDPGLARLLAASNREEPPSDRIENALSLATQAAKMTRRGIGRWLGPTIVAGVALGTSLAFVTMTSIPAPATSSTNGPPVTSPSIEKPTGEQTTVMPTVSVEDLARPSASGVAHDRSAPAMAVSSATVAAPRRPHALAPAPKASTTSFGEELALVSQARSALEAGDVVACRLAVQSYGERFPSGLFAQEIEVIRIEAIALSEPAHARAMAERFLATNARSPYADRLRSLLTRAQD